MKKNYSKSSDKRKLQDIVNQIRDKLGSACGVSFMASIGYKCHMQENGKFNIFERETGVFVGEFKKSEFIELAIKRGFNASKLLSQQENEMVFPDSYFPSTPRIDYTRKYQKEVKLDRNINI